MPYGSHEQKQVNECYLGNRRKGVTIIKTINHCVAFNDYPSFKAVIMSIRTHFDNIYPATTQ